MTAMMMMMMIMISQSIFFLCFCVKWCKALQLSLPQEYTYIRPCFVQTMPCLLQYKPFEVCAAKSVVMNFQMYLRQWSDAFDFCCSATSERNFPSASSVLRILDFILVSTIHIWKHLFLLLLLYYIIFILLLLYLLFTFICTTSAPMH